MKTTDAKEFLAALDHIQQLKGFIARLIDAAPEAAAEVYKNWKNEWPTAIETDPRKMPQAADKVMTGFAQSDSMYTPAEKINYLNVLLWSGQTQD